MNSVRIWTGLICSIYWTR